MTTASERLRVKLELAAPAVEAAAGRIWGSPRVRELYPAWLATMHGVVRTAVPLMEAALERARALAAEDTVARELVPYLEHHAPEERGHDGWLLEDLEALGGDPVEAASRIPSPRVATLAGAQYYWLRHCHPVSLLGHMAVMEGYSPRIGLAERLQALTGHPPAAFRAIRRHERLDVRHKRELYTAIDALPLRAEHEALMGISGLHTMESAIAVFQEIAASAPAALEAV